METLSPYGSMGVASFRPIRCRNCNGMPEVIRHRTGGTFRIKCGGCNEPVPRTFREIGDAVDAWNTANGGIR